KRFVPQQQLSAEQAFWYHMSNHSTKSSNASTVKMDAPKKLHKVSLVNESLKKLKFHLSKFDNVVTIRTTPDARTKDKSCDNQNALEIPEYFENIDLKAQLQDKDTTIYTPVVEKSKIDEDLQGKPVDATIYCGRIGSLMYLTSSTPELIYVVCLCDRYCDNKRLLYAVTMYNTQDPSTLIGKLRQHQHRHHQPHKLKLHMYLNLFHTQSLKQILSLLGKKVEAIPKSAWTEKDQIGNFLKEIRLMRNLEKFVGGRLYEVDFRMLQQTI
nr:hypothetical protein [Tanacetum cinerariifolium]